MGRFSPFHLQLLSSIVVCLQPHTSWACSKSFPCWCFRRDSNPGRWIAGPVCYQLHHEGKVRIILNSALFKYFCQGCPWLKVVIETPSGIPEKYRELLLQLYTTRWHGGRLLHSVLVSTVHRWQHKCADGHTKHGKTFLTE